MPRKLRIEYPGAIYHVMNRGDQREDIFMDDEDRRKFLSTLGEACQKTDWQVHAYCPMRNHFHLVVETPQANLAAGMKWLSGVYTKRFNIRHKLCGHLLAGRLQGSHRGWQRQRLFANGLRLRSPQPGAGEVVQTRGGSGELPLEQLWRVSQAWQPAAELASG